MVTKPRAAATSVASSGGGGAEELLQAVTGAMANSVASAIDLCDSSSDEETSCDKSDENPPIQQQTTVKGTASQDTSATPAVPAVLLREPSRRPPRSRMSLEVSFE